MNNAAQNNSNISVKRRVFDYIDFWNTPAPTPPSIRFLEALAIKFNIAWRPVDHARLTVGYQAASTKTKYYENMVADFDPMSGILAVDKLKEFEAARTSEFRHRIFRSLYWGNLYDGLVPIESRSYTTTEDRLPKLVFICALAIFAYTLVYFAPSVASGVASVEQAVYRLADGKLSFYSSAELANAASERIKSAGIALPSPIFDTNRDALEQSVNYRKEIDRQVHSKTFQTDDLVSDGIWPLQDENARIELITEIMFLKGIIENQKFFMSLNRRYHILVTPTINTLELITQLIFLVTSIVLISWFLAKKAHFAEIYENVKTESRHPSLIVLEEILLTNFFLRKKFHYAISITCATAAILTHNYAIGYQFGTIASPAAATLELSPFDFRISGLFPVVVAVNWSLQFVLVYVLVLVCWELRFVNECMRMWQAYLAKVDAIDTESFESVFKALSTRTRLHFGFLFLASFSFLFMVSMAKYNSITPSLDISEMPGSGTVSGFLNLIVRPWLEWVPWHWLYVYSPAILTAVLLFLTSRRCANSVAKSIEYADAKLPDLDALIEGVMSKVSKVLAAKTAVEKWQKQGDPNPREKPRSDNGKTDG